jgi:hypothetical protein
MAAQAADPLKEDVVAMTEGYLRRKEEEKFEATFSQADL